MKKLPILFMLFLLILATFLGGIRYGIHINSKNRDREMNQKPQEKKKESLTFRTFVLKNCKVGLLIPTSMKTEKESSKEALLKLDNRYIHMDCSSQQALKVSSSSARLVRILGAPIQAEKKQNKLRFQIGSPSIQEKTLVEVDESLIELVEETLKVYK